MTIKTRLKLASLIILGSIIVSSLAVFFISQELDEELQESQIAEQMLASVFDLNTLTTDYLSHHELRAQSQWHNKHDQIGVLLTAEIFMSNKENEVLTDLKTSHLKLESIFTDLVKAHSDHDQLDSDHQLDQASELESRLTSQFLIESQSMFTSVFRLAEAVRLELAQLQNLLSLVTFMAIFILLFTAGLGVFLIFKLVVKPLEKLKTGAEAVGSGDLSYQINIISKDEIGQLASSFNLMTQKLKESYSALEAKVKQRTQELEKAKTGLESQVQQRTKELELAKTNLEQQVADRTKTLKARVAQLNKLNKLMVGRELKMIQLKQKLKNQVSTSQ